jgi:hypothetical protein
MHLLHRKSFASIGNFPLVDVVLHFEVLKIKWAGMNPRP